MLAKMYKPLCLWVGVLIFPEVGRRVLNLHARALITVFHLTCLSFVSTAFLTTRRERGLFIHYAHLKSRLKLTWDMEKGAWLMQVMHQRKIQKKKRSTDDILLRTWSPDALFMHQSSTQTLRCVEVHLHRMRKISFPFNKWWGS